MKARYVFKNDLKGTASALNAQIDNSPTSASEKIRDALLNYGSQDFQPEDLADTFASINAYSGCNKSNAEILNDSFTYWIEAVPPKGSKKPNINVVVFKGEKEIFNGSMKMFVERATRLENTYVVCHA